MQVQAIIDGFRSPELSTRLDSFSKFKIVAQALGPESTRTSLLAYLHEYTDDEDHVLLELLNQLACCMSFIGGPQYLPSVFPILHTLSLHEDSTIRNRSVNTLISFLPYLTPQQPVIIRHVLPMIRHFVIHEWTTARVSAVMLIPHVFPLVPYHLQNELCSIFSTLSLDESPAVRTAACRQFVIFATYALHDERLARMLFHLVIYLSKDVLDTVRLAAVDGVIVLSDVLSRYNVQYRLLPIVSSLITDISWRVRYLVARRFPLFFSSLGVDVFANEETAAFFVKLLTDDEPEVRTAAANVCGRVCCLLGYQHLKNGVFSTLQGLSQDAFGHVRVAFSHDLLTACYVLPPAAINNTILPILQNLIADSNPEVQLNLFSSIHVLFNQTRYDSNSKDAGLLLSSQNDMFNLILPPLIDLSQNPQWRLRINVAQFLPLLARHVSLKSFVERILPIAMCLLCDPVASVRNASIDNFPKLSLLLGTSWSITHLIPHIQQLAQHSSYVHRYSAALALLGLFHVFPMSLIQRHGIPILTKLLDDRVVTVQHIALRAAVYTLSRLLGFQPISYTSLIEPDLITGSLGGGVGLATSTSSSYHAASRNNGKDKPFSASFRPHSSTQAIHNGGSGRDPSASVATSQQSSLDATQPQSALLLRMLVNDVRTRLCWSRFLYSLPHAVPSLELRQATTFIDNNNISPNNASRKVDAARFSFEKEAERAGIPLQNARQMMDELPQFVFRQDNNPQTTGPVPPPPPTAAPSQPSADLSDIDRAILRLASPLLSFASPSKPSDDVELFNDLQICSQLRLEPLLLSVLQEPCDDNVEQVLTGRHNDISDNSTTEDLSHVARAFLQSDSSDDAALPISNTSYLAAHFIKQHHPKSDQSPAGSSADAGDDDIRTSHSETFMRALFLQDKLAHVAARAEAAAATATAGPTPSTTPSFSLVQDVRNSLSQFLSLFKSLQIRSTEYYDILDELKEAEKQQGGPENVALQFLLAQQNTHTTAQQQQQQPQQSTQQQQSQRDQHEGDTFVAAHVSAEFQGLQDSALSQTIDSRAPVGVTSLASPVESSHPGVNTTDAAQTTTTDHTETPTAAAAAAAAGSAGSTSSATGAAPAPAPASSSSSTGIPVAPSGNVMGITPFIPVSYFDHHNDNLRRLPSSDLLSLIYENDATGGIVPLYQLISSANLASQQNTNFHLLFLIKRIRQEYYLLLAQHIQLIVTHLQCIYNVKLRCASAAAAVAAPAAVAQAAPVPAAAAAVDATAHVATPTPTQNEIDEASVTASKLLQLVSVHAGPRQQTSYPMAAAAAAAAENEDINTNQIVSTGGESLLAATHATKRPNQPENHRPNSSGSPESNNGPNSAATATTSNDIPMASQPLLVSAESWMLLLKNEQHLLQEFNHLQYLMSLSLTREFLPSHLLFNCPPLELQLFYASQQMTQKLLQEDQRIVSTPDCIQLKQQLVSYVDKFRLMQRNGHSELGYFASEAYILITEAEQALQKEPK